MMRWLTDVATYCNVVLLHMLAVSRARTKACVRRITARRQPMVR